MCSPISFEPVSFTAPPFIPNIVDDWSKVWSGIPSFTMPSITLPPMDKALPPITIGHPPLCMSKASVPPITVQNVDTPKISIDWGEPPPISCVILVQSPGCTHEEWLNAKEKSGTLWLNDKCEWVFRKIAKEIGVTDFETFVDQVYESVKMQPGTSDCTKTDDSSVERS